MEKTLAAALSFLIQIQHIFSANILSRDRSIFWEKENNYINGDYDKYRKTDGTINCTEFAKSFSLYLCT